MPTLICPICRKQISYQVEEEVSHRPFCSARCQQIDLGRWLSEEYRIVEQLPIEPNPPDRAAPNEQEGAEG